MRGKSVKGNSTPTKIQQINYKCSASNCKVTIKSHFDAALHPLLDCLVCRECYLKYGNGDFATMWDDGVDENGDDNYCRWCCDGGDLLGCMNDCRENGERCHFMFCEDCLKHNVPEDAYLNKLPDEEMTWICPACDRTRLTKQRAKAQEAISDLASRQTNDPIEDVTSQSTTGRATKNSERSRTETVNETPSKTNTERTAPKSTPTTTTKATSPKDDNIDVDVTSLSPSKQIESSTEDEEINEKKSDKKEDSTKAFETKSTESKTNESKATEKIKDKTRDGRDPNKKSSTTASEEPKQSPSIATSNKDGKKVKDNLSKRDREARVEGEPIVAPRNVDLIKLGGSVVHKNRDVRKLSDSFSSTTNPTKKRRTDSMIDTSTAKVPSTTVKSNGSTTKQTGLEPQMTYGKSSTGPSFTGEKQQTTQNGTSEKQSSRHSTTGPSVSTTSKTPSSTITKNSSNPSADALKKIRPNLVDFKKRLDYYDRAKQICLEEIDSKWNKIKEMADTYYSDADNRGRQSMSVEIDSLRTPLQEFESMLRDLKNLCC